MREQAVPDLIVGEIHAAGGDGLHGAAVPDEPRQKVRTAGFHDDAAARKHEADFGGARRDADVHGERHGDADADGGALEGADGGLAAVEDGEGDAASAVVGYISAFMFHSEKRNVEIIGNIPIPMIVHLLRFLSARPASKSYP